MTRNLLFIVVSVILISGAIFFVGCGQEKAPDDKTTAIETSAPETTNGSTEGTTETVAAKKFVCPMGCTDDVFDSPDATCPKCGMKCTKEVVEEEEMMEGDMEHGDMGSGEMGHDMGE